MRPNPLMDAFWKAGGTGNFPEDPKVVEEKKAKVTESKAKGEKEVAEIKEMAAKLPPPTWSAEDEAKFQQEFKELDPNDQSPLMKAFNEYQDAIGKEVFRLNKKAHDLRIKGRSEDEIAQILDPEVEGINGKEADIAREAWNKYKDAKSSVPQQAQVTPQAPGVLGPQQAAAAAPAGMPLEPPPKPPTVTDFMKPKPDYETPPENAKYGFGLRNDGTPKGQGYFGTLRRPDGGISTELSIGIQINGKETEIPSLVPSLTAEEVDHLLGGGRLTNSIVQKSVDHAKRRIAQGKSPFAQPGELFELPPRNLPKVYGYEVRDPYPSERDYFKNNQTVTGMATEDGRIVLNPFSTLTEAERSAVAQNEATRLFLRDNNYFMLIEPTPEQIEQFKGTAYSQPGNEEALKNTILARIVSRDPSIKNPTPEQIEVANAVKKELLERRRLEELPGKELKTAPTSWEESKGNAIRFSRSLIKQAEKKALDVPKGLFGTAEMYLQAARMGPGEKETKISKYASEWLNKLEQVKRDHPWLAEDPTADAVDQGITSAFQSLAAGGTGAVIGAVTGAALSRTPGGAWLGGILGYALQGGAVFGLAEYDQFLQEAERLKKQGMPINMEAVKWAAIRSGIYEGGFEFATDILEGILFGKSRPLTPEAKLALKSGLRELFKYRFRDFLVKGAQTTGLEATGEFSTAFMQQLERNLLGMDKRSAWDSAVQVLGPTAVSSIIFSGVFGYSSRLNRKYLQNAITNGNADPRLRMGAAKEVYDELKAVSPRLADIWLKNASSAIQKKQSISLDDSRVMSTEMAVREKYLEDFKKTGLSPLRELNENEKKLARSSLDSLVHRAIYGEREGVPAARKIKEAEISVHPRYTGEQLELQQALSTTGAQRTAEQIRMINNAIARGIVGPVQVSPGKVELQIIEGRKAPLEAPAGGRVPAEAQPPPRGTLATGVVIGEEAAPPPGQIITPESQFTPEQLAKQRELEQARAVHEQFPGAVATAAVRTEVPPGQVEIVEGRKRPVQVPEEEKKPGPPSAETVLPRNKRLQAMGVKAAVRDNRTGVIYKPQSDLESKLHGEIVAGLQDRNIELSDDLDSGFLLPDGTYIERKKWFDEKWEQRLTGETKKPGPTDIAERARKYIKDPELVKTTDRAGISWQELSATDLPRDLEGKPVTVVDYFNVPEKEQQQGVGKEMLNQLEKEASSKGHSAIIITDVLPEARGFYVKAGYVIKKDTAYKRVEPSKAEAKAPTGIEPVSEKAPREEYGDWTIKEVTKEELQKVGRDLGEELQEGLTVGAATHHGSKTIYIPKGLSEAEKIKLVEHEKAHVDIGDDESLVEVGEQILLSVRDAIANKLTSKQIREAGEVLPETVSHMRNYLREDMGMNEASLIEEAYAAEKGFQEAAIKIKQLQLDKQARPEGFEALNEIDKTFFDRLEKIIKQREEGKISAEKANELILINRQWREDEHRKEQLQKEADEAAARTRKPVPPEAKQPPPVSPSTYRLKNPDGFFDEELDVGQMALRHGEFTIEVLKKGETKPVRMSALDFDMKIKDPGFRSTVQNVRIPADYERLTPTRELHPERIAQFAGKATPEFLVKIYEIFNNPKYKINTAKMLVGRHLGRRPNRFNAYDAADWAWANGYIDWETAYRFKNYPSVSSAYDIYQNIDRKQKAAQLAEWKQKEAERQKALAAAREKDRLAAEAEKKEEKLEENQEVKPSESAVDRVQKNIESYTAAQKWIAGKKSQTFIRRDELPAWFPKDLADKLSDKKGIIIVPSLRDQINYELHRLNKLIAKKPQDISQAEMSWKVKREVHELGKIAERISMREAAKKGKPGIAQEEAQYLSPQEKKEQERAAKLIDSIHEDFVSQGGSSIHDFKRYLKQANLSLQQYNDILLMSGHKFKSNTLGDLLHYILDSFVLDDEERRYINFIKRNNNLFALFPNAKTLMSIDLSTVCPFNVPGKSKIGPCTYCYVAAGRAKGILAKKVIERLPYNGEILQMPDKLVRFINKDLGGLRMFSHADYKPEFDSTIKEILDHAKQKGLIIKAIVKQKGFVDKFGDHPNLRINISTDNVPRGISNAPTLEEAIKWKKGRDNIKIRAVALNRDEAIMFGNDPNVDVVTLYHGPTGDALIKFKKQHQPEIFKIMGEEKATAWLRSWQDMRPRYNVYKELQERFPGKLCCQGGLCLTDPVKCGFGPKPSRLPFKPSSMITKMAKGIIRNIEILKAKGGLKNDEAIYGYGSEANQERATKAIIDQLESWRKRVHPRLNLSVFSTGAQELLNKPVNSLKRNVPVDLVGAKIDPLFAPLQIAELFQIYRTPKMEVFHIVFRAADGTIIAHNAYTSGSKLQVNFKNTVALLKKVRAAADKMGAAKVDFVHNHPGGAVKASEGDGGFLYLFQNHPQFGLREKTGEFIVLNHGKYSYSVVVGNEVHGKTGTYEVKGPVSEWDASEKIRIDNQDKAIEVARMITNQEKGKIALVFLDPNLQVKGWAGFDPMTFIAFDPERKELSQAYKHLEPDRQKKIKKVDKMIEQYMDGFDATRMFVVGQTPYTMDFGVLLDKQISGKYIDDIIYGTDFERSYRTDVLASAYAEEANPERAYQKAQQTLFYAPGAKRGKGKYAVQLFQEEPGFPSWLKRGYEVLPQDKAPTTNEQMLKLVLEAGALPATGEDTVYSMSEETKKYDTAWFNSPYFQSTITLHPLQMTYNNIVKALRDKYVEVRMNKMGVFRAWREVEDTVLSKEKDVPPLIFLPDDEMDANTKKYWAKIEKKEGVTTGIPSEDQLYDAKTKYFRIKNEGKLIFVKVSNYDPSKTVLQGVVVTREGVPAEKETKEAVQRKVIVFSSSDIQNEMVMNKRYGMLQPLSKDPPKPVIEVEEAEYSTKLEKELIEATQKENYGPDLSEGLSVDVGTFRVESRDKLLAALDNLARDADARGSNPPIVPNLTIRWEGTSIVIPNSPDTIRFFRQKIENPGVYPSVIDPQDRGDISPTRGVVLESMFLQSMYNGMRNVIIKVFPSLYESTVNLKKATVELVDKLRFYPHLPLDYVNDVRKYMIAAVDQARLKVYSKDGYMGQIFGDMKESDIMKVVELIYARDEVGRQKKGKGNPSITLQDAFQDLYAINSKVTPEVRAAADKWKEIVEKMRIDLVMRGKLKPGDFIEDYAPHSIALYTPEWAFVAGIPKKIRRPFRQYTLKAKGTEKPITRDAQTLLGHLLKVTHHNLIENFIIREGIKYDIIPSLTNDQKVRLFGARKYKNPAVRIPKVPRPGRVFTENELVRIDPSFAGKGNFWVYSPDAPFSRKVFYKDGNYVMGGYKTVYLIPESIYDSFEHFSEGGNRWTYYMNILTSHWKSAAILARFLSYNFNNLLGDFSMAGMFHPEPLSFAKELDTAFNYIKEELKGGGHTGYLKDLHEWMTEHDILGASFYHVELPSRFRGRKNPVKAVIDASMSVSQTREALGRVAYASSLFRAMQEGRGQELIDKHDWIPTTGLSENDALGKIARVVLIDYAAVSKKFKTWMRGFLIPFGTWPLKASYQVGKWSLKHPFKSTAILSAGPLAAAMWNNSDDEKKQIEMRLPDWARNTIHLNIGYAENGDMNVLIFQLPQDALFGTKIFSIATDYASRVVRGEMTPREAALKCLKAWGLKETRGMFFMVNALFRYFVGLSTGRDPFDKSPVFDRPTIQMNFSQKLEAAGWYFMKTFVPLLSVSMKQIQSQMPIDVTAKETLRNFVGKEALGVYSLTPKGEISMRGGQEKMTYEDSQQIRYKQNRIYPFITDVETAWIGFDSDKIYEFTKSDDFKAIMKKLYAEQGKFNPSDFPKDKAEEERVRKGMALISEELVNLFDDLDVKQKKLNVMWERAETPEQKEKIIKELDNIRRMRVYEAYEKTPSTQRMLHFKGKFQKEPKRWQEELTMP